MKIQKYSKGKQLEEMSVLDAQIAEASKNASAEAKQAAQNLVASTQNYLNSDPLHNGQERRLQIEMKRKILSILTSGEDLEKRLQGNPVYDPYRMGTADKNSFGFYTRGELDNIANEIARQTFTAPKEQTVTTGTPASSIIPSWDFKKFLDNETKLKNTALTDAGHTSQVGRAKYYQGVLKGILSENIYTPGASISGITNGVNYDQLKELIETNLDNADEKKATAYIADLNKTINGNRFSPYSTATTATETTTTTPPAVTSNDIASLNLKNSDGNALTGDEQQMLADALNAKRYTIKNGKIVGENDNDVDLSKFYHVLNFEEPEGDKYGHGFYFYKDEKDKSYHFRAVTNLQDWNEKKDVFDFTSLYPTRQWQNLAGNPQVGELTAYTGNTDKEYLYNNIDRNIVAAGKTIFDISHLFNDNSPVFAIVPPGSIDIFGNLSLPKEKTQVAYIDIDGKIGYLSLNEYAQKHAGYQGSSRYPAQGHTPTPLTGGIHFKDIVRVFQDLSSEDKSKLNTAGIKSASDLIARLINLVLNNNAEAKTKLTTIMNILNVEKGHRQDILFSVIRSAQFRNKNRKDQETYITNVKNLATLLQYGGALEFKHLDNSFSLNKQALQQAYSQRKITAKKSDDQLAFEAGWTAADIERASALALDAVSMGAAIAGDSGATIGGWAVAAGTGIGSTVLNTIADFSDKGITTGQALKNLGINFLVDAASTFLPHLVSIKMIKTSKPLLGKILKNSKWLSVALPATFAGVQIRGNFKSVGEAAKHLLSKDKDLTAQDAMLLGAVLSTVMGTVSGVAHGTKAASLENHGASYKGKAGDQDFRISNKTKEQIEATVAKGQKDHVDHTKTKQQVVDTLKKDRYNDTKSAEELEAIANSILGTETQSVKDRPIFSRSSVEHEVATFNPEKLTYDFDIENAAKYAYLGARRRYKRGEKDGSGYKARTGTEYNNAVDYLTTLATRPSEHWHNVFIPRENFASRRTTGMDATIQPGQTTPQAASYRNSRKNTFSSADGKHRVETTKEGIVYTNTEGKKIHYTQADVVKDKGKTVITQEGAPTITITPGEKTIHINTGGENVELNFGGSKPKKQKTASANNPESVATESQAIVNQTSETKPKNNKKVSEAVTKFLHNLSERKKKAQQAWRDYRNFTWGAVETNKRHVTGSNRRAVASSDGGFTNNPADRPVTPPETSRFSPDGNATTFDVSRRRTTNPKEGNDMSDAAIREFLNKNNLNDQFGQKKNGHWYAKGANKEKIGKRGNSSQVQFKQTPSGHVYIVKNGSKLNRLQTYLNSK